MTMLALRGGPQTTGAYLLHIRLVGPRAITFGRFAAGRHVSLAAGEWLYAGSAMGAGATALAGRLLRHATRCPPAPPHRQRDALIAELVAAGLAASPPPHKRRHWHIDYLLDDPAAELDHIWAVRSVERLEAALVARLAAQPGLQPGPLGLGATDHPGYTHLWQLLTEDWSTIVAHLDRWLSER